MSCDAVNDLNILEASLLELGTDVFLVLPFARSYLLIHKARIRKLGRSGDRRAGALNHFKPAHCLGPGGERIDSARLKDTLDFCVAGRIVLAAIPMTLHSPRKEASTSGGNGTPQLVMT